MRSLFPRACVRIVQKIIDFFPLADRLAYVNGQREKSREGSASAAAGGGHETGNGAEAGEEIAGGHDLIFRLYCIQ